MLMMEKDNYSIQQLKLEVGFYDKEGAYDLQNKLSRLYHQQIHATLHDFFRQCLPKALLIRKDSLVVDLGSMRYEQLEKELPARLAKALEELFSPVLSKENNAEAWNRQGFESLALNDAELSLLEFYLVNGTFPWLAATGTDLTWKGMLNRLYTTDRSGLGHQLHQLGRQEQVRKRLAFQSDQEDMEKVITAIITAEADTIITYQKKISAVQQEQQIIKAGASDFNSAVSFFILTYLLKEQGSLFSQKMFVKSVLIQMAAHYNVSYFSVLAVFQQSLRITTHQTGTAGNLYQLIAELEQENTTDLTVQAIPQNRLSELLHYYLQHGLMPWWAKDFNGYSPEILLKNLYSQSAGEALLILKKAEMGLPLSGADQSQTDHSLFTAGNPLNSAALVTKEHLKAAKPATGLTQVIRQQSLNNILEYYLTWNRLPDSLPFLSGEELDNYLTNIILLLYQENPEALKRMMRSEKHAAAAHMHIHKLFIPDNKGGDYKKLSLLLEEYIEKDALQYLKEMAGSEHIGKDEQLKPALDRLLKKAKRGETNTQLSVLLNSVPLTKYIALNYGEETIQWLITSQTGDDEAFRQSIESIKNLILDLVTDIYEKQRLRHLLNEATLFYLYLGHPKGISTYINAVFRYLAGSAHTPTRLFSILIHKIQTDSYLGSAKGSIISVIRHELKYQLQQQELAEKKLAEKREMEAEEIKSRETAKKAVEKEIATAQDSEKQQIPKKALRVLDKGDKLYIRNAGLILLHPFLSTYFTRLNLMEKGKFINRKLQARAVHLLQYLAYTTTSNPEHELVLNKILCNYPLYEPLPLKIILTQQEIEVSLEIIQVVIERSGKLSSSSPEGFRASFLQREGAITATAEEWTLRVEQRGYDLILQTLPWSFGMIKFQWMDKPMITEWI